jgi:hypothetical protein
MSIMLNYEAKALIGMYRMYSECGNLQLVCAAHRLNVMGGSISGVLWMRNKEGNVTTTMYAIRLPLWGIHYRMDA